MEGETSGRGTKVPQLHPLQNPVILAHLFKRCPPALLAQCRLVSKQWLELSLTYWRATSTLRLYHDHVPGGVRRPTLQQYLEFMNSPKNKSVGKPHRNMILVSWKIDLREKAIQSFWNRVGRDLASLALVSCEFGKVIDLRQIIFGSCPNLKRLLLHSCKFFQSARVKDFRELEYATPTFGEQNNLRHFQIRMPDCIRANRLPIHWLELFSHFPSLTSMKVSVSRESLSDSEGMTEEILQAVGIIKKRDKRKLCLEGLDLDPPFKFTIGLIVVVDGIEEHDRHRDLSKLEELQLPLQSLEIEVYSNLRDELLEGVLNRHRDTLSRITVSRPWNYEYRSRLPFSWGFPCNVMLEKLEELRIHMLCTSMEFLKNTPKLKKLEFLEAPVYGYSKDEETRIFQEPDAVTLVGVKLLHLTEFRMDYKVTSEDIAIWAGLMPNVRKLAMSLTDALFATVCKYWKDVKEMEVLGWDLTDDGVIGFSWEFDEPAPASITNLQDLESFKFYSQYLTDRSVLKGFLKLHSFKVLEVKGGRGMMPFGETARKALQDRNIDFKGDFEDDWEDYSCRAGDYDNWADDDSD